MKRKKMNGAQAVIETLRAQNIDVVFGIPGGHNLEIFEALRSCDDISLVGNRHEQNSVFMADGYARATGKIGTAILVSGPGVANAVTGLGEATTDTSPVLVVASTIRKGNVGRNKGGLHDLGDTAAFVRPLCRKAERCTEVARIPETITGFCNDLRYGRPGTYFCEIPVDVLSEQDEVEVPKRPAEGEPVSAPVADISKAVDVIRRSKRPVLWVGTGATASGARAEVTSLAETLSAPVFPTSLGRGIMPSDHPLVMHSYTHVRTEMHELIEKADCVITVGTMFKEEDTGTWSVPFPENLIHIDIDPSEFGKNFKPKVALHGDAKTVLQQITASLADVSGTDKIGADASWPEQFRNTKQQILKRRWNNNPTEMEILKTIREVMPRESIIVGDRCSMGYWANEYLDVYQPRSYQYPMGFGTLGYALPAAIGAKVGCPDKDVLCIIGDGGFQFTMQELATAAQYNIPITIFLGNDNGYAALRAAQDKKYDGKRFAVDLRNPDFCRLAESYGIPAVRITEVDQIAKTLKTAVTSGKLNFIEFQKVLQVP